MQYVQVYVCEEYIYIYPTSWIRALSLWKGSYNSVKLWIMLCRSTQDKWVIVKNSDKTWTTGGGNGNQLHYWCLENPTDNMERQKDMTPEDELPRSESIQYAAGEEQKTSTNSSRKNEATAPKQKWHSDVDVSGGESPKEQYCIGTWNVRSMLLLLLSCFSRVRLCATP